MAEYGVRNVRVEDLVPGMFLHSTAITESGRVVLRAGTMLNERAIEGLKTWNITHVEIQVKGPAEEAQPFHQPVAGMTEAEVDRLLHEKMPLLDAAIETAAEEPAISEEPVTEEEPEPVESDHVAADLPDNFINGYRSALLEVKHELALARFQKNNFSTDKMKSIISQLLLPLLEDPSVFWKLQFIEHTEDYLYHHSIDVAILAGCIGGWMGCSSKMQEKLMWGGLMHDVGKALIPLKIINKSGSLTDEEWNIAQLHAIRGYKYLRKNFDIPHEIFYCVLQHHERMDGSGYPLSLLGDKIDVWARVIAVADIFSAMTSSRSYGKRRTSYDAAATIQAEMFGKLDSQISLLFLGKLRQFFQANRVRLIDGREAEVVFLNHSDDSRPMVRTDDGKVIDLNQERKLAIRRVLY